ncbi:hypothetical protein ACFFWD_00785 [Bradyrhizobium erythrophlei]|uniref:hypothetical protein n=1 Tax=Bradyrhizobium erythrophlei TaxID=1437360 RepID=UPI0035EA63C9
MSILSGLVFPTTREHSILGSDAIGEIMLGKRHCPDAQRDVTRRGVEQKLEGLSAPPSRTCFCTSAAAGRAPYRLRSWARRSMRIDCEVHAFRRAVRRDAPVIDGSLEQLEGAVSDCTITRLVLVQPAFFKGDPTELRS